MLTDKLSEGVFKGAIGKEEIAIKDIHSKNKYKLTRRDPYSITIEIKMKGIIREYTGKMLNPAIIKKIEKELV
ncbi:MAG TPA: Ger(x)C family spore germination protein, partial [Bacillus bacterium]|nr:Ger(x)C family spore germination protein [Bacillus sp. (in: firmicutes)]